MSIPADACASADACCFLPPNSPEKNRPPVSIYKNLNISNRIQIIFFHYINSWFLCIHILPADADELAALEVLDELEELDELDELEAADEACDFFFPPNQDGIKPPPTLNRKKMQITSICITSIYRRIKYNEKSSKN